MSERERSEPKKRHTPVPSIDPIERFLQRSPKDKWDDLWKYQATSRSSKIMDALLGTASDSTPYLLHPRFREICQNLLNEGADVNQTLDLHGPEDIESDALLVCMRYLSRFPDYEDEIIELMSWLCDRGAFLHPVSNGGIVFLKRFMRVCIAGVNIPILNFMFDHGMPIANEHVLSYYGVRADGRELPRQWLTLTHRNENNGTVYHNVILPRIRLSGRELALARRERFQSLSPNQKWEAIWMADESVLPSLHMPGLAVDYVYMDIAQRPLHPHFLELCQQILNEGADVNHQWTPDQIDNPVFDYDGPIDAMCVSCWPVHCQPTAVPFLLERGATLDLMLSMDPEGIALFLADLEHETDYSDADVHNMLTALFDHGLPLISEYICDEFGVLPNGSLLPTPDTSQLQTRNNRVFKNTILPLLEAKTGKSLFHMSKMAVQKGIRQKRIDPKLHEYLMHLIMRM